MTWVYNEETGTYETEDWEPAPYDTSWIPFWAEKEKAERKEKKSDMSKNILLFTIIVASAAFLTYNIIRTRRRESGVPVPVDETDTEETVNIKQHLREPKVLIEMKKKYDGWKKGKKYLVHDINESNAILYKTEEDDKVWNGPSDGQPVPVTIPVDKVKVLSQDISSGNIGISEISGKVENAAPSDDVNKADIIIKMDRDHNEFKAGKTYLVHEIKNGDAYFYHDDAGDEWTSDRGIFKQGEKIVFPKTAVIPNIKFEVMDEDADISVSRKNGGKDKESSKKPLTLKREALEEKYDHTSPSPETDIPDIQIQMEKTVGKFKKGQIYYIHEIRDGNALLFDYQGRPWDLGMTGFPDKVNVIPSGAFVRIKERGRGMRRR